MKQAKQSFRHFFLRTAAAFLACAAAIGAVSTAAFRQYEIKCAESQAALQHRSFERKLSDMDILGSSDNEIKLQLALYASPSGESDFSCEAFTDTAYLLYDTVNQRVIDSSPIAWALIKSSVPTPDDIPDSPELADAETGEYFDGSTFFRKSFFSTDPDMLHTLHPFDRFGGWLERDCHEIYAKGDTFYAGAGEVYTYPPLLEGKEYHADFDFTPADKENYTHFYDSDWNGDATEVPADAVGVQSLFLVVVGSQENGTALAEVRHMYEANVQPDNLYRGDCGYQPLKAPGGILLSMQLVNDDAENSEPDRYYGYYVAYYHFWAQWHWYLIFFYGFLLILALVLALLTGKIKYQKYSKQFEINEYRRRLTGQLAHDLKSPLTVISGLAENLRENVHTEKRERYADAILENTQYMDGLISDTLALAKLENAGTPDRQTTDLMQLTKDAFARCSEITEERGLTVRFAGSCTVSANPKMMRQAIENLVWNAVRYTPENGAVDVKGEANAIRIVNDAENIPEHPAALAEPYAKGDASRGARSGSGLGLSIVRQIAEMNGLTLQIRKDGERFSAALCAGRTGRKKHTANIEKNPE